MARGRITTYEIDSFSKQAVGVPGEDHSGQILAQGINSIGHALQQRQQAVDGITALSKYGDFEFEYSKQKIDLQNKHKNSPNEYPQAFKTATEKLIEKHGKGLSEGVSQKFKQMATSTMVQDIDNAYIWSAQQEIENTKVAIIDTKQKLALSASGIGSAPELQELLLIKFGEASTTARKAISVESDMKLTEEYTKLAKANAMLSQIYSQPTRVLRDLQGGAYDGVLTPEEITTYSTKARTAIHNKAEDDLYRSMYVAQGEVLDLQQKIDEGSISLAELIARRQAALANKDKVDANGDRIVTDSYLESLDILVDQMLKSKKAAIDADDPTARALKKKDIDKEWDSYLLEKGAGAKPDKKDIERELMLFSKISDAYSQGYLNESEYRSKIDLMRTRLTTKASGKARVMSFDQALQAAGKESWWKPNNDVFVYGYKYIKDFTEKAYKGLEADVKRDLQVQMMAQYTQYVKNLPEDFISKVKNDNERQNFARNTVMGYTQTDGKQVAGILSRYAMYKDSTGKVVYPGDRTIENGVGRVFVGLNPNSGKPIWELDPSFKGKIIRNSRGDSAKIIGISVDGQPILERLANGK